MTTKADYSPEEWKSLLVAPFFTSMLVVISDMNMGFFKELAAMGQAVMLSATHTKNDLIRDISTELNKKETQETLKPEMEKVQGQKDPQALKQTFLDAILGAAALVESRSSDDATGYRQWLFYLAQQTAEGAKEGGFLGIGAVRVSEKEKAMLAELSQALGVDTPAA
jgi:hypothetical protein